MFDKLLVANRGEIACRIIRTANRLKIPTVAVYSKADQGSMHVALADESVEIGAARPSESYLNIERIIDAATQTNADSIHPGYGFLSENSEFAKACNDASVEFIGPSAKAIEIMASKSTAAGIAENSNVPILPGVRQSSLDADKVLSVVDSIGFPILIKSALGGGGRGMRLVETKDDLTEAMVAASSEAKEFFGDDLLIIEKYLEYARHVEVQIAADKYGNTVHLFDRDCSAQRRYQKIIEEAPAPEINEDIRQQMYDAAISLAKSIDYHSVGTIEFLFDSSNFYFMEMNTRLQVEHPVTEKITGIDLVEWQLRIAAGQSIKAMEIPDVPRGHGLEVRIYAENPTTGFLPSPGSIQHLQLPKETKSVSVHSGVREGDKVDRNYDPMIAKLITHEDSRNQAVSSMLAALEDTHVVGVQTNIGFLFNLLQTDAYQERVIDIRYVGSHLPELVANQSTLPAQIPALLMLYTISNEHEFDLIRSPSTPYSTNSLWKSQSGWRLNSQLEFAQNFAFNGELLNVFAIIRPNTMFIKCNSQTMHCDNIEADNKRVSATINKQKYEVSLVQIGMQYYVFYKGTQYELNLTNRISNARLSTANSNSLIAPLPGRISRILIKPGETVVPGQNLVVIEAMKMEHQIKSPIDGKVSSLPFNENDQVEEGETCVVIEPIN